MATPEPARLTSSSQVSQLPQGVVHEGDHLSQSAGCGTSRKTLEILEQEGAEVTVVDYLKHPPSKEELKRLYERAGSSRRGTAGQGALAEDLDLLGGHVSDDADPRRDGRQSDPDRAAAGRDREGRAPLPPAGQGARNAPADAAGDAARSVAVYSLKGGVGKTTIAVNLAWAAAALSKRSTCSGTSTARPRRPSCWAGAQASRRRRRCSPATSRPPS
jgi:hypothetical protein